MKKGFPTGDGYMGFVEGRYILFASESDYYEYMNDWWRVWRMKGIFGSMFDLDHDGTMSPMESAMEFAFLD